MRQSLTLKQKIGQRMFVGVDSYALSSAEMELVCRHKVGNFILFGNNIRDRAETLRLCRELDRLARAETGVGAFIAVDEEGGRVARIPADYLELPSAREIAKTGDAKNAYDAGVKAAKAMRDFGMNFNFAPVLDTATNPKNDVIGDRSYGSSPEKVAEYGIEMMRGLLDGGVLCCGKHFPGHGNTSVDSHIELPRIDGMKAELMTTHIKPFTAAIKADIPAIMTAHIVFSALSADDLPATLSREVVTGLLRNELGFDGLIISDCMEMGAIAKNYGTGVAAMRAVAAGVTMLTVSHSHEAAGACADSLYEAYTKHALSMEDMDAEIDRIMEYKAKLGLI